MDANGPVWSFKKNGWWCSRKESLGDGLIKTIAMGGSALLVKREVFDRLERPCFKITYKAIDEEGRCFNEGEDEYFCRIAIEAGYDVIVDPTIVCKHFNYKEL